MKVLDLQCSRLHVFEGWFGSDADFRSQHERGLVTCPMCGDADVQRRLSAPRLNRKSNTRPAPATGREVSPAAPAAAAPVSGKKAEREVSMPAEWASSDAAAELMRAHQAAYLQVVQHVVRNTEDVGERFAEEARRMHYGEREARGIRGQATAEEKAALSDEGIDVVSLPIPKDLDGPLQ